MIIKVSKREDPFVMIDKKILEDSSMSWKAKGLLAYLLSRPNDWQVMMADLINRSTDGREAVLAGMNELRIAGYAHLKNGRSEGGRLAGKYWVIYDSPTTDSDSISPINGFSDYRENRSSGKPIVGKSATTNNEEKTKNKSEATASEDGLAFADWFRKLLPEDINLKSTWRESFGRCFDELIRLDKRTKAEIYAVCEWARKDSFWSTNFLSPLKLRDKKDGVSYYDKFKAKYEASKNSTPTNRPGHTNRNAGTFNDGRESMYRGAAEKSQERRRRIESGGSGNEGDLF